MSNCGSTPTSLSICLAGANWHSAAAAGEAEAATASPIALAVATSSMRPRGAIERMRPSRAAIPKKPNKAIPIPPYIPRSPMCPRGVNVYRIGDAASPQFSQGSRMLGAYEFGSRRFGAKLIAVTIS